MIMSRYILLFLSVLFFLSCHHRVESWVERSEKPPIYPDYTDVTIPYNMAPLNFLFRGDVSALRVCVYNEQDSLLVEGKQQISFPLQAWKDFMEQSKGQTLQVILYAQEQGSWYRYSAFSWSVSSDPLDGYLSYRLIEPGYEVWNHIQLCERNLENFEERVIADNNLVDGNCMNCHIYGNHQGSLSCFHLRGEKGGTILNKDGKLRKLRLKNEQMVSAATYGDIHPKGTYGVFSSNQIIPAFHLLGNQRLEAFDMASDLVVVHFDTEKMTQFPWTARKDVLETFPTFSADGKWVYYCAASAKVLPDSIYQLKYSLCRVPFKEQHGELENQIDTIWNADEKKASVCFPKASPDGRFLLFTVADYGTFPLWHRETDLQMMDLQSRQLLDVSVVNSDRSDTYHSWSSTGRWFVFASKRGDGQYGKPYFVHVSTDGKLSKPFLLPQKDAEHYDYTLKSYNIPELSETPVPFDAEDIRRICQ